MTNRPHVVLLVVDSLRSDYLGCYKGRDLGTPNIDGLARQGVLFRNAISQAPSTRSSVASLLTGLYPSQHGLVYSPRRRAGKRVSIAVLEPRTPTLAKILAAAEYTTARFYGGLNVKKPTVGLSRGFSHVMRENTPHDEVRVKRFEEWLQAARPDRLFCYLHFFEVHSPLLAEIKSSTLAENFDIREVKQSFNRLADWYADAIRRVDAYIGRILQTLDASGMLEDTWIILLADHGQELMEHGGMLGHSTLYRELVHVPLVMRLPRLAYAGVRIDEPVQLIDIMPTVLDYLGLAPMDVPARTLLPLLRGEKTGLPAFAFSELHRPGWYSQSVTTATHQLIHTYVFDGSNAAAPADLRPGLPIEVRGHPIQGSFLATNASVEPRTTCEVTGTLERVDVGGNLLVILGLDFFTHQDTEFLNMDKKGAAAAVLAKGDRVSVSFTIAGDGRRLANRINRRRPGGKSKIQGVIERVWDLSNGFRCVTVLGVDVLIRDDLRVKVATSTSYKDSSGGEDDALRRVLAGDYVERRQELYDLRSDPTQIRNVVEEQPDLARELEGALETWARSLAGTRRSPVGPVSVDSETLKRLRRTVHVDW